MLTKPARSVTVKKIKTKRVGGEWGHRKDIKKGRTRGH